MDQIRAAVKYVRSFLRREWTLRDYPLRFREHAIDLNLSSTRFQQFKWIVQIVNWWQMSGGGMSREEALADLARRFEAYRATHALPRPGAHVAIEFAPAEEISQFEEIAHEVIEKLFGIPRGDCLLTDESSLWDFHFGETNEPYLQALKETFGVDASELERPTIIELARRIYNARQVA